jgi:hypothetical protein
MLTPDEAAIKFSIGFSIRASSGFHRSVLCQGPIKIDAGTLDVLFA